MLVQASKVAHSSQPGTKVVIIKEVPFSFYNYFRKCNHMRHFSTFWANRVQLLGACPMGHPPHHFGPDPIKWFWAFQCGCILKNVQPHVVALWYQEVFARRLLLHKNATKKMLCALVVDSGICLRWWSTVGFFEKCHCSPATSHWRTKKIPLGDELPCK